MIHMKELTKQAVGHWVTYTPSSGEQQTGRIKSWNDKFIFVVYKCAGDWGNYKNYTGVATNLKNLVAL